MFEYDLKRSGRKTLSLEITPELHILVRAPMRLPRREIDRFVEAHSGWIASHLEKQRCRAEAGVTGELSAAEVERLKEKALAVIPGRVEHYGALMGLRPAGIKITGARTRFGSCSGKNHLCFSYRLMLYPPEAVDYVVVHELAHIRHKNHGPAFYFLIAQFLPDYQARRNLLRQTAGPR